MILNVPDGPKALRETLGIAQSAFAGIPEDLHHITRLQRLVAECDRHRPLGPDGKHGDRHTATCGCEDVAPPKPVQEYLAVHRGSLDRLRVLADDEGESLQEALARCISVAWRQRG
jgi:hypothetical protein